jgi:hypothetical protein
MDMDDEVKEVYKSFWKPILGFFGLLNFRQVKRELHDFHICIENVPKVYMEVTRGRISKANTLAWEVIGEYENDLMDNYIHKDDLRYIIENFKGKSLIKELNKL